LGFLNQFEELQKEEGRRTRRREGMGGEGRRGQARTGEDRREEVRRGEERDRETSRYPLHQIPWNARFPWLLRSPRVSGLGLAVPW